jgi:hypothetical protein
MQMGGTGYRADAYPQLNVIGYGRNDAERLRLGWERVWRWLFERSSRNRRALSHARATPIPENQTFGSNSEGDGALFTPNESGRGKR